MRARVCRSSKREFECRLIDSGELVTAKALGLLLKEGEIVVGDYVVLSEIEETGELEVVEVEERTNEIYRLLIREGKRKVTASNCDVMIVLTSVTQPEYKRGVIDRFLVRADQWNIRPIVVFNKMDLYDPELVDPKFERDRILELGVECFEISALHPEYEPQFLDNGFEELKQLLKGKTAILLGQSGVGKSKLISKLSDGKIELLSQELGKKSGKGAHTTTWSEIVECEDFSLIDSPGIRSISIDDISEEFLISHFPDLAPLVVKCKFTTCTHAENMKGCYFNSLDPEDYGTQLILSRLESYLKMEEEIQRIPDWEKNER